MYNLVSVRTSSLEEKPSGEKLSSKKKVYNSILELTGDTPLVRLNKIPKQYGLACDIYAKCEFLNPAGSIKDRVALAMVRDAKESGVINKNTEFIEPTSGNTGIGIAFNAALMDNKCTIVMDVKNSAEKVDTMRLLGAEVIQVRGKDRMIARQLKYENPDAVILNQFENEVNPKIHYETTGAEIVSALDRVDMVVMGAGTGGTMSGVGRRLKEKNPGCVVVAAEPEGSIMINTEGSFHPFLIEGVGGNWVPSVLDKSVIDHTEVVSDEEAFLTARELIKKEGLLCGGSSGAAMAAAIKAAKAMNLGAGKHIVVILPDGIRNYMSKFVNDQWMEAHLYMDPPERTMKWWKTPITELTLNHKYPALKKNATCEQALRAMSNNGNVAVITDDNGYFVGAVSKDSLRSYATNPLKFPKKSTEEFDFKDLASEYLVKNCYTLAENGKRGMPTIGLLSRILDITPFVIIGREEHDEANNKVVFEPKGVVTGDDVLDYIHALGLRKLQRKASRTWA